MNSEPVSFVTRTGVRLSGRLDLPDSTKPIGCALLSHGFACSKNTKAMRWISMWLARQGVAVLRFDFTGLGESEGQFSETTFSTNLDDIAAAVAFLRDEYVAPQILMGHSLGGMAMLAAAGGVPTCRLVATIASPADTKHIRNLLVAGHPDLLTCGEADVSFGGRRVNIRKGFLDDLAIHQIEEDVARLGCALMAFHSPVDEALQIDHAIRIFQAAKPPKYFITLDGADHLLVKREQDSRYIADTVAAWARRYLAQVLY
jgi:putative redox protein